MELRSAVSVPKSYRQVAPQQVHGLLPCSTSYNPLHRKNRRSSRLVTIRAASSGDNGFDPEHRMVDADMIVLRKRIYEMKLQESNKDELPQEWMEWEKNMHPSYNSMVFYVIAWAQYFLMTARPGVAVAVLTLLSLSVPTSVYFATLGGVNCVGEFMSHIQFALN